MRYQTISDEVADILKETIVSHALFTTYNLDLVFFETEIIPLLFSKKQAFSNDARIKELQVRDALSKSKIKIDLFYDGNIFEEKPDGVRSTPMMEYGFIGIDHKTGAFHPKIIMALGETPNGQPQLIVGSGSNNCTKSGWWDNIETINFIVLSEQTPPTDSLKRELLESLDYLSSQLYNQDVYSYATENIKKYLANLNTSDQYFEDTHFFFLNSGKSFPSFLSNKLENYNTTQIISPYFPNNSESDLYKDIFAENTLIYLPGVNLEDGWHVQCSATLYEYLNNKGLIWSELSEVISREIVQKNYERVLHAKIFTFSTVDEQWVFAGSVNFTQKAFYDNIEAGFLFAIKSRENILIETKKEPVAYEASILEEEYIKSGKAKALSLDLYLLYDWNPESSMLYGTVKDLMAVTLYDMDGNELCTIDNIKENRFAVQSNEKLKQHFEKSHYVYVNNGSKKEKIFVLQKNWDFKPLYYPDLTPQQIIHIYTTMNPDKRDSYIIHAMVKKLIASGETTEYTDIVDEDVQGNDFFSEYAEIFFAFRQLKQEMSEPERRQYYLYAERPDSIKSLITRVEDSELDTIVRYLILLSANELYSEESTPEELIKLLNSLREKIADKDFLDWFESEFNKEYRLALNEK